MEATRAEALSLIGEWSKTCEQIRAIACSGNRAFDTRITGGIHVDDGLVVVATPGARNYLTFSVDSVATWAFHDAKNLSLDRVLNEMNADPLAERPILMATLTDGSTYALNVFPEDQF